MTDRPPRVSVCIPVYNGADYIGESLCSVLAQTYEDYRVVVVDNCSTDGTADVVRSFRDSRLTYVRNSTNLGAVGNFNRCLELADGEYVNIWHHDDVMLPENIERKVRVLDKHPSVGYVHSNLWLTDAQGHPFMEHWHEDSKLDYVEPGAEIFRRYVTRLHHGALIFMGTVLARRVCYERLGGFRPELPNCCDSEMWMRLALFCDVACLSTPLVKYRQHGASLGGSHHGPDMLREHYTTALMIFRNYGHRIPDRLALLREVRAHFASETVQQARAMSYLGKRALSRRYLFMAARLYPEVLATKPFWWQTLKWVVGAPGVRLYAGLRHILRRREPRVDVNGTR